jgi:transposase
VYIAGNPSQEVAMAKRYRIELNEAEREELERLTKRNATGAKRFVHARTLLLCDCGPHGPAWTNARVAEALGITSRTVENTKRRLVEGGLSEALDRKKRATAPRPSIFDGEKEARLVALACSEPPAGRKRWTVRLLAEKLVELEVFEHISKSSVQNALKKTSLSLT